MNLACVAIKRETLSLSLSHSTTHRRTQTSIKFTSYSFVFICVHCNSCSFIVEAFFASAGSVKANRGPFLEPPGVVGVVGVRGVEGDELKNQQLLLLLFKKKIIQPIFFPFDSLIINNFFFALSVLWIFTIFHQFYFDR